MICCFEDFADGTSVAFLIEPVFWIPSSSMATAFGFTWINSNGPVLVYLYLLYSPVARRSAVDIFVDGLLN